MFCIFIGVIYKRSVWRKLWQTKGVGQRS